MKENTTLGRAANKSSANRKSKNLRTCHICWIFRFLLTIICLKCSESNLCKKKNLAEQAWRRILSFQLVLPWNCQQRNELLKRGVSSLLSFGEKFADLQLVDWNTIEICKFADYPIRKKQDWLHAYLWSWNRINVLWHYSKVLRLIWILKELSHEIGSGHA